MGNCKTKKERIHAEKHIGILLGIIFWYRYQLAVYS